MEINLKTRIESDSKEFTSSEKDLKRGKGFVRFLQATLSFVHCVLSILWGVLIISLFFGGLVAYWIPPGFLSLEGP